MRVLIPTRACTLAALSVGALFSAGALAGAPATAPQVLIAITNSESMDGETDGAILTGAGFTIAADDQSLTSLGSVDGNGNANGSSSPKSFAIPAGFTPPLNLGYNGWAPYTVACGPGGSASILCDNSDSRLNLAKASIQQVLNNYGNSIQFGLYTYATSGVGTYTTWVYYMSPATGNFTFQSSATPPASGTETVINPCYLYQSAGASPKIAASCAGMVGALGTTASNLNNSNYMVVGASSDDPLINDVLYASLGDNPLLLTYGSPTPSNPYTYYPLSQYIYNIGGFSVGYNQGYPAWAAGFSTTPTNAGYVPYSPQVMYANRGFGYGANQSANSGSVAVAMGSDPVNGFTTALAPETNNAGTHEIKALAGQSAIAGLINGSQSYLSSFGATCNHAFIVLLTDGLPTMDLNGGAWPPLGTTTANNYGLTATFNPDGSFVSSNSQAVTDAINAIAAAYAAGTSTYVIGLGAGVDPANNPVANSVLRAMAIAGGTSNFYPATNAAALNSAFNTIVYTIYTASSVSAPIAPITVSGGTSLVYDLTTFPAPIAGHASAYTVTATGVPSSTPSWDAASLMTTANRTSDLLVPTTANTLTTLGSVDAAAFNLTATKCVPDTATIINYTINPSFTPSTGSTNQGCSYLAGRQTNWYLGAFSARDSGQYVGPPGTSQSSGTLATHFSSYVSYARSISSRTPMLMFTNDDGFLYAVNASNGSLLWGFTTRNILAQMQNYLIFESSGPMDGGFTVIDGQNGGSWGSYVVGSAQSGREHYALKLSNAGIPTQVIYDTVQTGYSPGDLSGSVTSVPTRQPAQIAYAANGTPYQIYVNNAGGTSTLWEVNVATGASSSATLPFFETATISLNSNGNQLYLGAANGKVYWMTISGSASSDIATIITLATITDPVSKNTVSNLLYVGYVQYNGTPYVYALTSGLLTVLGISNTGWTPLWAANGSNGYTWNGTKYIVSASVGTFNGSVVSDIPEAVGSLLLVPSFLASPTGCGPGNGYYEFFNLANGGFPANPGLNYNGTTITQQVGVGAGAAFTPPPTLIQGGFALGTGSQGNTTPQPPISASGIPLSSPFSWQQR